MAQYTPKTWTTGETITAAELNALEQGLATAAAGVTVAAAVTAGGALVVSKHNPVDATAGALTMTLPTGQPAGTLLSVEKADASQNVVTISGNLRGAAAQTVLLSTAHEGRMFVADAAGSWWPLADHRTKTSLDNAYVGYLNVKAYGAKGDGTTDDTAAVAAAVAAATAAGGGIVYAPKGTYRITGAVQWANGVALYGDGPGRTIFKPEGSGYSFISNSASALGTPTTDCVFRDFEIDGSNYVLLAGHYDATQGKGIYIQYLLRCLFRNLYVHDCGATGLGVDYLVQSVIENVTANNNGRLGTTSVAGASGIGIGTGAYSVESLVISNCHANSNKRNGIFVEKNSGFDSLAIRIVGCYSGLNGDCGIGDAGAKHLIVDGCTMYQNPRGIGLNLGTFTGPVPGREGLITNCMITGSGANGIFHAATTATRGVYKIANSKITLSNQAGIKVEISTTALPNITISDCEIYSNKLDGIWVANNGGTAAFIRPKIVRNSIWANGTSATAGNQNGIRIDTPMTSPQINQNICYDDQGTPTQLFGLAISGTVTGGSIDGNHLRENGTGAVNITGAMTTTIVGFNSGWTINSGTPEGVVTAPVGTLYRRLDGGAGTSLYVKETGTAATGWVGK